jgi:GNAT superfamily N-acetyltransferase
MNQPVKKLASLIPAQMKPQMINRLIAADTIRRDETPPFQGDSVLAFLIAKPGDVERVIEAMEAMSDFSDPCPFHEWLQYGTEEASGSTVIVGDSLHPISGFVVFDTSIDVRLIGSVAEIALHVDIERLYIGGKQRNKGFGKALIAYVIKVGESLLHNSIKPTRGSSVSTLTLHLTGDSLSAGGDRLLEIFKRAISREALGLIRSGKIVGYRLQDMTCSLADEE